jgi:hypothetical protein
VNEQVKRLTDELRGALGVNLVGIYLHGSLALGCFNPARSDIDVLVVTERPLSAEQRVSVMQIAIESSGNPNGLELSSLAWEHLDPWRHPTPYDLHFSKTYVPAEGEHTDPDLAAHVSVTRRAGVALHGPPPELVFPPVPHEHYADALMRDLGWTLENHPTDLYGALSPCRVWAGIAQPEALHTKESAAAWALERVTPALRPVLAHALAIYRGERKDDLDPEAVRALAVFVAARVEELRDAETAATA